MFYYHLVSIFLLIQFSVQQSSSKATISCYLTETGSNFKNLNCRSRSDPFNPTVLQFNQRSTGDFDVTVIQAESLQNTSVLIQSFDFLRKAFPNDFYMDTIKINMFSTNLLITDFTIQFGNKTFLSFDNTKRLQLKMRFYKNTITANMFTNLPLLTTLDITSDNLKKIKNGSFSSLKSLTRIILQTPGLLILGGNEFKGMASLEKLDLSFVNNLNLGGTVFNDLVKLKYLQLGNNITVSETTFCMNKQLQKLFSVDSKVTCDKFFSLPDSTVTRNIKLCKTTHNDDCITCQTNKHCNRKETTTLKPVSTTTKPESTTSKIITSTLKTSSATILKNDSTYSSKTSSTISSLSTTSNKDISTTAMLLTTIYDKLQTAAAQQLTKTQKVNTIMMIVGCVVAILVCLALIILLVMYVIIPWWNRRHSSYEESREPIVMCQEMGMSQTLWNSAYSNEQDGENDESAAVTYSQDETLQPIIIHPA